MKNSGSSIPENLFVGPVFDEEEVEAVTRLIRSRSITQLSSTVVEEFEQAFAGYVGARYAMAVSSGTSAVHTALAASGVGPGDEVIVPAFTFIGTVGPVLQLGAIPVFADMDERTYCMSVDDAASKITERTKAIMPVDIFGHPADLDGIHRVAQSHGLAVIEDACQSHGSEYRSRRVGGLSPVTCFSFQESKNMTTGEGGMVTTNDPDLARLCQQIRHQGQVHGGLTERLGFNYRMTALQAAIGLVQLRKLDGFNGIRRSIAHGYTRALQGLDLQLPEEAPYAKSVYHVYTFLLPEEKADQRDEIVKSLLDKRVPAGAAYSLPLYRHPVFANLTGPHKCPMTESVTSRVVTLLTTHSIGVENGLIIADTVRGLLEEALDR